MARYLFTVIVQFVVVDIFAQAERREEIVFAGLIVDSVSQARIPAVHISNGIRGAISNSDGLFAIGVAAGDTILFTHISYHSVRFVYSRARPLRDIRIVMVSRAQMLPEVTVRDVYSEQELKNKILDTAPAASREQQLAEQNSGQINVVGRTAPPPETSPQEEFFRSLHQSKDVTILSTNPQRGLWKIIRDLRNPKKEEVYTAPSGYRSDPKKITPFKIRLHKVDSVARDTTFARP